MSANVFCPKCGTQNQSGAAVCANCSTALPTVISSAPAYGPSGTPAPQTDKSGFTWVTALFLFMAVVTVETIAGTILFLILAYLSYKNGWGKK